MISSCLGPRTQACALSAARFVPLFGVRTIVIYGALEIPIVLDALLLVLFIFCAALTGWFLMLADLDTGCRVMRYQEGCFLTFFGATTIGIFGALETLIVFCLYCLVCWWVGW